MDKSDDMTNFESVEKGSFNNAPNRLNDSLFATREGTYLFNLSLYNLYHSPSKSPSFFTPFNFNFPLLLRETPLLEKC